MPHYFLDTSALAKLYCKEIGSDLVDRVAAEPDFDGNSSTAFGS